MSVRRDEREKIVKMGREWKRLRRAGRGFSLLELMVSVGIMSVTLLLVLAVFTGSMRASRKTTDLTAGVVVAETVLNEVVASSSSDDAGNSKKDKYSAAWTLFDPGVHIHLYLADSFGKDKALWLNILKMDFPPEAEIFL